jgi:putative ABC transport system permease protein
MPRSGFPVFSIDNTKALAAHLGGTSAVALTTPPGVGGFVTAAGTTPRAAAVTGVYGASEALFGGAGVVNGRFLTEDEMAGQATVAVIAHNLAKELAGDKAVTSVLATPLMLQGRPWTVVGVLDEAADQRRFGVFVPIGSLPLAASQGTVVVPPAPGEPVQRGGPPPANARNILVRAPQVEDVLSTHAKVEAWADATEPRWRKDQQVTIVSQGVERLRQINQGMLGFKLLMGSFAAISLVVGGIGIMNVLLAAVAERTREIGVRKAAGATRRDILVQFLAESVTISLTGSTLGGMLGFAGAVGITAFIRWQTNTPMYAVFTLSTFVVAMGTAIAVGLIFGVYPALKAARLSPVDAMRFE